MPVMRSVLVWLLLALLPWRLWAADTMALQSCHAPTPSVATPLAPQDHAASLHALHTEGPAHDATRHAARAPSDGPPAHDPAQHTHAGCSLCDICHNTPLVGPVAVALRGHAPQRWGLSQSHLPPSPTVAPPHKPPIA